MPDQTIGEEFRFEVYSRRWGRPDTYKIKRTAKGWEVNHISIGGLCDKRGVPFLYKNFDQDLITYPSKIPDFLEHLWDLAEADNLTKEAVQKALNLLGDWVSKVEKDSLEMEDLVP